jgi:gamma-glutamyltranspeptidase/glutathione hydrolase
MILNIIDFDMNIQEAIAAPRIAFIEPNTLAVESTVSEAIRETLASMGHEIRVGNIGNAHGLTIEYDASGEPIRFTGGTDPRGGGLAKGY